MIRIPVFALTLLLAFGLLRAQEVTVELINEFGPAGKVEYVTFNPTGTRVAAGTHTGKIHVWNVVDGEHERTLSAHRDIVNHLAYNHSGSLMASASSDGTVVLWDMEKGMPVKTVENPRHMDHFKAAYFVVWGPNENYLYFGGRNTKLCRVAVEGNAPPEVLHSPGYAITCALPTPDGKYLAFAYGKNVAFWDWSAGKIASEINYHSKVNTDRSYINDLAFAQSGKTLLGWCENGTLSYWDYPSNSFKGQILAGDKQYSHIAVGSDDRYVITGNAGNMFRVWEAMSGKMLLEIPDHSQRVRTFAFSPDGRYFVSGSYDGSVKLWKFVTDRTFAPPPKPEPKPQQTETPTVLNDRKVDAAKTIIVKSTNLTVNVWDDKKVDGDIISMYYNDKCIVKKHSITRKKKKVKISINPNDANLLTLHADNMGKQPPNTAAVTIDDGYSTQKLVLSSDFTKSEAVNIVYKP